MHIIILSSDNSSSSLSWSHAVVAADGFAWDSLCTIHGCQVNQRHCIQIVQCLPVYTTPVTPVLAAADAQIDALATVLRLLYIKDLRHLQTTLDRVVVQVQVSAPECAWQIAPAGLKDADVGLQSGACRLTCAAHQLWWHDITQ